jgi:hypothetical protein
MHLFIIIGSENGSKYSKRTLVHYDVNFKSLFIKNHTFIIENKGKQTNLMI